MRRWFGFMLIVFGLCIAFFTLISYTKIPLDFVTQPLRWDDEAHMESGESVTRSMEGVDVLEIDVSAANVHVSAEDTDELSVELLRREGGENSLRTEENGERISIGITRKGFLHPFDWVGALLNGEFLSPDKLYVRVPEHFDGSLVLDAGSGAMTVSGLDKLNDLMVDISSGSVEIEDVRTKAFEYDGSSGQLSVSGLQAEEQTIDISSGNVYLEDVTGRIQGHSSSGSVVVDMAELTEPLTWEASTGSVTVRLPEDASFILNASTSTGSIDSEFPLEVQTQRNDQLQGRAGEGDVSVNLSVSTGRIRIEQK